MFVFVRERRGFWGAFSVGAYGGGAISLFSWMPILGYPASIYGICVSPVGGREMHGTSTTRASLAAPSLAAPSLAAPFPALLSLLLAPALFLTPPPGA